MDEIRGRHMPVAQRGALQLRPVLTAEAAVVAVLAASRDHFFASSDRPIGVIRCLC